MDRSSEESADCDTASLCPKTRRQAEDASFFFTLDSQVLFCRLCEYITSLEYMIPIPHIAPSELKKSRFFPG